MANSQTDMDDWVKAIRRVIWAPFGGGKLKHEPSDILKAAFTPAACGSEAEMGVTGMVWLAKKNNQASECSSITSSMH